MKNLKKPILASIVAGTLALSLGLAGCGSGAAEETSGTSQSWENRIDIAGMDFEYTDRDKDSSYDASTATKVNLQGSDAEIEGDGASVENGIVTIAQEGTYVLNGQLNGEVVVEADDQAKIQIVLDNASISNTNGPAIALMQADKVFVTLADGSQNSLSDGTSYQLADGEDEPNATLYSKADLTLNGSGSLSVTGSCEHAVNSKDDLVITGGSYTIKAADDGLRGKDCVKILDGSFNITAGSDGIKSSNDEDPTRGFISIDGGQFDINASDDGMQSATYLRLADGSVKVASTDHAFKSDIEAAMLNGTYTVSAGGKGMNAEYRFTMDNGSFDIQKSTEGIESEKIVINDGTLNIVSSDDGLNAAAASTDTATSSAANNAAASASNNGQPLHDQNRYGMTENAPNGDFGKGMRGQNQDSQQGQPPTDGQQSGPQGGKGNMGGFGGGDEAANPNCLIQINGGTIRITAGGDCIDSNGNLEITGGKVYPLAWSNGNEALDYNGTGNIADGCVIMESSAQNMR